MPDTVSDNRPARVELYDTTLRDGTQAENINFSVLDKLRIAERLDAFGIDYIEGGFPGSNPKDVEFFAKAREHEWKHAKIAAFGATRRPGAHTPEDAQVKLLLDAGTPVVTVVGKSWDIHVTGVLNTTLEENLKMIEDTCRALKEQGREVIYDAEHLFDGYKANADYTLRTLEAAARGGADRVVLCDTNGGCMVDEVKAVTSLVAHKFDVPVGIHTHDDSGVGVANALVAVQAGATQVQGTINGYGERTGNCNLTTVIPNLQLKMDRPVVANLKELRELSLFVDDLANLSHNIRAPFVGEASFAHKGGQHVNAMQKLARSYEHIDPAEVGNRTSFLVSDVSGQSTVLMKTRELGYELEKGSREARLILERVKHLEHEGYEFEAAQASFELLVRRQLGLHTPLFDLESYHCDFRRGGEAGNNGHGRGTGGYRSCEGVVKILVDGEQRHEVAEGNGPVEALDKALRKALRAKYPDITRVSLEDYKVRIIDGQHGTSARTRVLIVSTDGKEFWGTVGCSFNIIQASWVALVDSFEYALSRRE
jgi:2-isopropylmalate synthase